MRAEAQTHIDQINAATATGTLRETAAQPVV